MIDLLWIIGLVMGAFLVYMLFTQPVYTLDLLSKIAYGIVKVLMVIALGIGNLIGGILGAIFGRKK